MRKQTEKKQVQPCWKVVLTLVFFLQLLSCNTKSVNENIVTGEDIQHGIVYYEEGRYGGWPANHGIWSWGDEILVGFVAADYSEDVKGMHTYDRSSARIKYARSKDGGESWIIEDAFEHGQTAWGHDNSTNNKTAKSPVPLNKSIDDFTSPGFTLTFLRHDNNKGPSHFYYSNDRGANWEGPYLFPNLNTDGVATRTDYIVEEKKELSVFLTVAKSNGKEGRVVLSRTTDGGLNWELVSWIGPEPKGFDIMPSSVRLSPTEFLTVIRTRTVNGQDLLTSYLSEDNGKTWEKLKDPVADTGKGGSPPALIKLNDGRLALSYIYRSEYGSRVNVRFSSDGGRNWSDEIILRCCDGANRDAGYPRMVQRSDGKLVIIYYWNNANREGTKPYRYIASTIFDPARWN